MDILVYILKGMLIGIFISLPVGPAGIYSIRRTLDRGWFVGFISCLGIVAGDIIYASIAGLGVYTVVSFLEMYYRIISVTGGLLIILIGIRSYFKENGSLKSLNSDGIVKHFTSSFFITLANPFMIVVFMAIFAGLGITDLNANYTFALFLISGLIIGATLTWFVINISIHELRKFLDKDLINLIHKISSVILIIIGMYLIVKSLL